MDKELELFEDKKDGRRLTASAKLHQARGDRFVALRNSSVDGNEFLPDVAGLGASAAIVSDPTRAMNSPSDLALLQVQDTLTTLHKLAPSYRQLMPQRPASSPSPASSGKTTTQDLVFVPSGPLSIIKATSKSQPSDCRAPQPVAALGGTRFAFRDD